GVIVTGWLPLTLTLPWVWPRWRERIAERDARLLVPLIWVVMVIVFFSFPKGKRDVYIMPALPLLILCISPFLHNVVENAWFKRIAWTLIALLGAGFLATGLYALFAHPPFARELVEQRGLASDGALLWWLLIALGAWTLACAAWFRWRRGVHALLARIAGVWLLWSCWAYPLLNDSSSAAGLMRRAGEIVGPQAALGLVAWKEQNLLHADRRAVEFGFTRPWHEQLGAAIRWQEAESASTPRW